MAKKSQAAPPAEDVSPFEGEMSPTDAPPTDAPPTEDGRPVRPEEQALAQAGPMIDPPDDGKKPPKYGVARQAGPGPAPRICHPLERAGEGQRRFKVRCQRSSEQQPTRYILAADRDEAAAFYCTFQKLDAADQNLKVAVTELAD